MSAIIKKPKFGRNYQLKIQTDSGSTLVVEPPLTIELDITQTTLPTSNVCQVRVFNLSEKNRNKIKFNISNFNEYRTIELAAGYGDNLARIFKGNLSQCWSTREGVDFVTQIECYDGGFAFVNGRTSGSKGQVAEGTSTKGLIENLISSLPNIRLGVVGNYEGTLTRPAALVGPTTELISEQTGGSGFFIDQETGYALKDGEFIDDGASGLILSPASGLLGTPVLEQTILHFEMIFEPTLRIGRKIKLQSTTDPSLGLDPEDPTFNGEYKVISVTHRGTISESRAGRLITMGGFYSRNPLIGVR